MTIKNKKIILAAVLISTCAFLFAFLPARATNLTDYQPREPIPGYESETQDTAQDFYTYVSAIYKFGLAVVGICALIMLAIGGFMYATSAGNNAAMEKAKSVITDAIIGLILALLAWVILYKINPDLVSMNTMNKLGINEPSTICPGGTPAVCSNGVGTPPNCTPPGIMVCSPPMGGPQTEPLRQGGGAGGGTCEGLPMKAEIGQWQCDTATSEVRAFLKCLGDENVGYIISSVSDNNYGVDECREAWCSGVAIMPPHPSCAHGDGGGDPSCHYCRGGSRAIDFSYYGRKPSAHSNEIQAAAQCAGVTATIHAEPEYTHDHININCSSAQDCYACDNIW